MNPSSAVVSRHLRLGKPHSLCRILWPRRLRIDGERAHNPLYAKTSSLYVPSLKDDALGLEHKMKTERLKITPLANIQKSRIRCRVSVYLSFFVSRDNANVCCSRRMASVLTQS